MSLLTALALATPAGEPSTVTATGVGTAIDTKDFEGSGIALLVAKNTAGTTPTLAVKLTESDTSGGTYTDVTGGGFTGLTTVDGLQAIAINFSAGKRYKKFARTVTGTTPSYQVTEVLLGYKKTLA